MLQVGAEHTKGMADGYKFDADGRRMGTTGRWQTLPAPLTPVHGVGRAGNIAVIRELPPP